MLRRAGSGIIGMTTEVLVNGMVIFLSATAVAIVAIVLQRRRHGHQR
jgi:hypothetical protein